VVLRDIDKLTKHAVRLYNNPTIARQIDGDVMELNRINIHVGEGADGSLVCTGKLATPGVLQLAPQGVGDSHHLTIGGITTTIEFTGMEPSYRGDEPIRVEVVCGLGASDGRVVLQIDSLSIQGDHFEIRRDE
jgi:hypothetical protein